MTDFRDGPGRNAGAALADPQSHRSDFAGQCRRARARDDQGYGQGHRDRDEGLRQAEAFRERAICASMESFVFELTGATGNIAVHQSHAVDRSRRGVAHQRRRDVARAKCDFRPRQPSLSFAIPISKNESPLSTIRLLAAILGDIGKRNVHRPRMSAIGDRQLHCFSNAGLFKNTG